MMVGDRSATLVCLCLDPTSYLGLTEQIEIEKSLERTQCKAYGEIYGEAYELGGGSSGPKRPQP